LEETPVVEERKIIWVCLSVIERDRGLFMCLSLRVKCVGEIEISVFVCIYECMCERECVSVCVCKCDGLCEKKSERVV
jgi:hypothetical protein